MTGMNFNKAMARRAQRNELRAKRAALKPLRNAVNKALKDAGFNKAQMGRNGRIGFATVIRDGWVTESLTHTDEPCVEVSWESRHADKVSLGKIKELLMADSRFIMAEFGNSLRIKSNGSI